MQDFKTFLAKRWQRLTLFGISAVSGLSLAALTVFWLDHRASQADEPLQATQPLSPQISAALVNALPVTLLNALSAEGETTAAELCFPVANLAQAANLAAPLPSGAIAAGASIGQAIRQVNLELAPRTVPIPWPQIHQRAKLAQVPVVMYHDILAEKEVFFDVTPDELEQDFELIRANGLTPVSLDQLVHHLRTGTPLPDKPILLTFDDGYAGHYTYVYPLLKRYRYPATFSVFTGKLDGDIAGRSTLTWQQVQQMAEDPLITFAAHSVTHPRDLRPLTDAALQQEVFESKRLIEEKLGQPIRYFTYPEGKYDERVAQVVADAGYSAALTMDDVDERFAGESESLLAIARFGQSRLEAVIPDAWGGPPVAIEPGSFDFNTDINLRRFTLEDIPLFLVTGGKPTTIHADSRYQVAEIIAETPAIAAVDGAFFSLKYLDSNTMIGPIYSQSTGEFVPGNTGENPLLAGRPLVLISPQSVKFVPFEPDKHNTLAGIQAEAADVTDAFVAAAWLVKDGQAREAHMFGNLFDYDAERHRAFWGIDQAGRPVIGVSNDRVDSMQLGSLLSQLGLREAVMLDSGASTSLVYGGEALMRYTPRPVPHVVALMPPQPDCLPLTAGETSTVAAED
ncbi:polysaccharide deacetylase family protein [Almyronema epifaneia]|uniref:Polysaccharide deacetylase family protein n=1 Tax=Almyronema epifaneia S1 TaxID=2991925 RepID=A0ABW6IHC7_9CYAN